MLRSEILVLLVVELARLGELRERFGAALVGEALRQVDSVEAELLERWGGREADRTDGYLLLFAGVEAALGWAADTHAALRALSGRLGLPIAARVGIHRGEAFLIDIDLADRARGAKAVEVEGLVKPAAARIMTVAPPGTTLLSAAAAAAASGEGDALRSRGWWALKGLPEPLELFTPQGDAASGPMVDVEKAHQVVWTGDLWRPVREIPSRWPAETDAFFGRAEELDRLEAALREEGGAALLVGPTGVGKRRLALHFGWRWRGAFPGGLWLGPAPVGGLGLSEVEGPDGEPAVWLGRGPGPWQAPLRLPIGPLLLPGSAGDLAEAPAGRLFLERARARRPGWRPADPDALVLLLRHLGGAPRAIEEAARRILVLSPREMLERLGPPAAAAAPW